MYGVFYSSLSEIIQTDSLSNSYETADTLRCSDVGRTKRSVSAFFSAAFPFGGHAALCPL
ncbi:MAG: hypothetical protein BWK80_55185 [Desulfobacteraceae bacterium IS3]|nr:MAG: hypothetical protein BWK80_55185 [Desulfobacteraceae bacterium IS3]